MGYTATKKTYRHYTVCGHDMGEVVCIFEATTEHDPHATVVDVKLKDVQIHEENTSILRFLTQETINELEMECQDALFNLDEELVEVVA